MANDGLITEVVSKQAIQELQNFEKQLLSVFEQINKFSTVKINLPSQLATATAGSASSIQKTIQLRQQSEKVIERERLAELKLQRDREQAFIKYDKQTAREESQTKRLESAYGRIQASVNVLSKTYQDLAIRKQLGSTLTTKEEAQLLSITNRLNMYQTALKKVDSDMQRNQRNVGNYASGFDGLGNSINQITRELPAFTFSAQTGILALSNNIPILTDEIGRLIAQNKQLVAQGQPVKSVFSQILSSFLSFQTAMGVGILLLTLYGKEIGEWASGLFGGAKALDAIAESQKQLTTINKEAAESVVNEKVQFEAWLSTAQDVNLSLKEREIAADKILKQYPFWFENLGKEKILNGQVAEAVQAVNDALLARAKANAAVGRITENQTKIIDIELKQADVRLRIGQQQAKLNTLLQIQAQGNLKDANSIIIAERAIRSGKAEEAKLQAELNGLEEINNKLTGYAISNTKESIGLDYQSAESKKQQTEALKDFLATQYELNKLRLENELSIQEHIFNDEAQNLERREVALKAYHEIQRQLADNALAESLRINELETDNEIKAIQKRVKEKEITEKNGNAVIYSLRKNAEYKNLIAYEQYAEALRQIDISMIESMRGVANEINFGKAEGLINERDLRATTEYVDKLQEIVKQNKDYRGIQKANKEFQLANQGITKANMQLEIERIETELRGIKDTEANVQKRIKLENSLILKRKELANVTKDEAEAQGEALEKLQKATESYLNSFTSGAFASFGLPIIDTLTKIEENGKIVFQNLIEGANGAGEKFAVVFNSSLEVAQQFYNALQQYNNQRFEREYANEERAYNIATQFYAKTDAARQELDRQYEEKRREIKRRELQAQKEQAIFNAIINTAQAVTSALPNYVLAALVGALGAAQIALISSQQIPAYKDGGENLQGLAWVGDGGRSEIIKTPSGELFRTPATDTLVNLPKGSNVYPSEADFIRKHSGALFNSPAVDWQGGRMPTAKEIGIELGNQIKNMPTSVANFDKAGFNSYVSNGHGKKTTFDNKVTMKGLRIK